MVSTVINSEGGDFSVNKGSERSTGSSRIEDGEVWSGGEAGSFAAGEEVSGFAVGGGAGGFAVGVEEGDFAADEGVGGFAVDDEEGDFAAESNDNVLADGFADGVEADGFAAGPVTGGLSRVEAGGFSTGVLATWTAAVASCRTLSTSLLPTRSAAIIAAASVIVWVPGLASLPVSGVSDIFLLERS